MTGTTLAHYRVVCKLSGGGMSILCEAEISDLPAALPLRSFPRTYFVNVFQIRGLVAQGLKPAFSDALSGTAEAVPSPKPNYETRSRNLHHDYKIGSIARARAFPLERRLNST